MQHHTRCNSTKSMPKDPKQMLLTELSRQDREESSKVDIICGRPVDQRLGASDVYLVLDSSQRDLSSSDPDKGLYVFNIRSGGITGDQMIGVSTQLNDITEIEVQSWPMPELPSNSLPSNIWGALTNIPILVPNPPSSGNPLLNQLNSNRFLMEIKETSMQSFSDLGGVRHTFAFDVLQVGNAPDIQNYASPVSPVYVFTDPITRFDTLSLVFRNPPRPLQFANDTLSGTRFAINLPDNFEYKNKSTDVKVVTNIAISPFDNYAYDAVAKTITFNCNASAVNAFIEPSSGSHIKSVQNGAKKSNNLVQIDIGDIVLFSNIEGVGEDKANGVYSLTSVGASATFTTVFTRQTDFDTVAECEQYSTVMISSGYFANKKFILNSTTVTDFDADVQNWVDYTTLALLSLYYSGHGLTENTKLTISNLDSKTVPQKIYNYLTRKDGLFVGNNNNNTADYFRLNPDVSLAEYVYTSITNNNVTKDAKLARKHGFNTIQGNQIVVIPVTSTKTISQFMTAIGAIGYETPPARALYGISTMQETSEGNQYKTSSTSYNTAVVLDKDVTDNDRYVEFEYTGTDNEDLSEVYVGIVPNYNSDDFTTNLLSVGQNLGGQPAQSAGWAVPAGNTYGDVTFDADNSYNVGTNNFNTACIVNKDIKDGDYVVYQNTSTTQNINAAFAITDQTTYEAIANINLNFARKYDQISANENFIFRILSATEIQVNFDGTTNNEPDVPEGIPQLRENGKILMAVGKIDPTHISIGISYIQPNNEIALTRSYVFTVVNSDTWFASNKKFYVSVGRTDESIKPSFIDLTPKILPSGFVMPKYAANIPLSISHKSLLTPLLCTYGNGSVISNTGGSGYHSETVTITGGNSDATATATVFGGVITKITITNGGTGYVAAATSASINKGNITPTIRAVLEPIITGDAITAINIKEQSLYSTNSSNYNTAAIIDTDVKSGNYAVFRYTGEKTKVLNMYVGLIDKDAYQNMRFDKEPTDWTNNQAITANEGILINFDPYDVNRIGLKSLLSSPPPWIYPSEFPQGIPPIIVDGVYTATTTDYNTACINPEALVDDSYIGIEYLGDLSKYPNIRYGMVSSQYFNQYLQSGPLKILPNIVWNTPLAFSFGSASTPDGLYTPTSSTYYDTAAGSIDAEANAINVSLLYKGAVSKQLDAMFGVLDKNAYEGLSMEVISDVYPLTLAKNVWNLPAPYAFLSSNDKNNTYRTNTVRYNTAAISDIDIRTTPAVFQYTGRNTKHLTSYQGYIDKTIYESLTGVSDGNNWSIAPQLTSNNGILFRLIHHPESASFMNVPFKLPSDLGWTLSTANANAYSFGSANITNGKYSTNSITYNTAAVINKDVVGTINFKYSGVTSTDLYGYFGLVSKEAYEGFSGAQADATNWASSKQITSPLNSFTGVLFSVIPPTDPNNTFSPNSAIVVKSNQFEKIYDLGIALPQISTGGQVELAPTRSLLDIAISNSKWTTPIDVLYGESNVSNGVYTTQTDLYNTAAIYEEYNILNNPTMAVQINDVNKSLNQSTGYIGFINKSTYENLSISDNNWTNAKQITENEGFIFRYLSPTHPDNTLNTGSGANLTPIIEDGSITSIEITDGGSGYTGTVPAYIRGDATATISIADGVIKNIIVNNGGINYNPATASISFAGGSGFIGNLVILDGVIISVNIVNSGTGYTTGGINATITDSSGTGAGASITANAFDGVIVSVSVTNTGTNYSAESPPIINVGKACIEHITNGNNPVLANLSASGPEIQDGDYLELSVAITNTTEIYFVIILKDKDYNILFSAFNLANVVDNSVWMDNHNLYITNNNPSISYTIATNLNSYNVSLTQGDGTQLFNRKFYSIEHNIISKSYDLKPYITTNNTSEEYETTIPVDSSIVEYTVNGSTIYSDLETNVEKISEGGWNTLKFMTSASDVKFSFTMYQNNGDILATDSHTITSITANTWHTNKRAYITTNSKGDKYVSNPTITNPKNWAVSDRLTINEGLLIKFIAPTEDWNPYGPNNAVRYAYNGIPNTTDVGSALANINTDGSVVVTSAVQDPTTVRLIFALTQSNSSVLESDTHDIAVNDSATWINNKITYVSSLESETYKTYVDNPTNWAIDPNIFKDGFSLQILSPTDPLNTVGGQTEAALMLTHNDGNTVVQDLFDVTEPLNKGARIRVKVKVLNGTTLRITSNIIQDNETPLITISNDITVSDTSSWLADYNLYVASNDPTESYTTARNCIVNNLFDNSLTQTPATGFSILVPCDQYSDVIVLAEKKNSTTITFDINIINSDGVAHNRIYNKDYTVADPDTWFDNKRFYITTNSTEESYSTNYKIFDYDPDYTPTGPIFQIDANIPNPFWIDGIPATDPTGVYNPATLTKENWTNSKEITTRDGFLINIDFSLGGNNAATVLEQGNNATTLTHSTALASNTKLNKGAYFQLAINRSTNDINYEIVVVSKDNALLGKYNGSMAVTDGAAWLDLTTKKYFLTTNKPSHTFKINDTVHPYLGSAVSPSGGYIDVGSTGYQNFISDFTNIVPGKSLTVGSSNLVFGRGLSINDAIISLTGQEDVRFNKFYQLESLDDIKENGIRLTENNVIFVNSSCVAQIPSRRFRIPMRFRRLLRRLTNLSGI